MELREYLSVLARRRQIVAAVFVAAVAFAVAVTLLQPPKWTGRATLRVEPSATLVGGSVQADDVKYLDRLVNTYAKLATSDEMAARLAHELRLGSRPKIEFRQLPNTNLVTLSVTTGNGSSAARAANRAAALLISQIETLVAADARASEASFNQRTRRLERDKARAEAELEQERAEGSPDSERALLLEEQINGLTQRLAVLRDDHERYQATRDANSRAVSLIAAPTVPTAPENRNVTMAVGLALLLAAIAAPALALLAESLSQRFRSRDEIEEVVEAPVLAALPSLGGMVGRSLVESSSPAEEAFDRARTTLLLRARSSDDRGSARDLRTILVTSAHPGEGKSTVVANLGRSFARSGRPTLIVDADLRRPALHEFFDLHPSVGFSELLHGRAKRQPLAWSSFVVPTGVPGLDLLPAGGAVDDSPTLLGQATTSQLLAELAERYEQVLIDSPAVLAVTDALAITRNVDGVLLIAGWNIERDALRHAHQELARVGAPVVGVVLNAVDERGVYFPYVDYAPERRPSPA